MPTPVSTRLNLVSVYDTFRVIAVNQHSGLTYIFRAHGDISERIKMEFTCSLTFKAEHGEAAHVVADTIATDGYGNQRRAGTGRTLQELIHNMDWPHRPSELAELKSLLATRQFTNCKELIGAKVSHELNPLQTLRTGEKIVYVAEQLGIDSGGYQAFPLGYRTEAEPQMMLAN